MEKFKIISLVSAGFMLVAVVLVVVSLVGKDWDVVTIEIEMASAVAVFSKLNMSSLNSMGMFGGDGMSDMMKKVMGGGDDGNRFRREIYMPVSGSTNPFDSSSLADRDMQIMKQLKLEIQIKIGLKEACTSVIFDGKGLLASITEKINQRMPTLCKSMDNLEQASKRAQIKVIARYPALADSKAFKGVNAFLATINKVFIFMVFALVFAILALLTSAAKTPCIKIPNKGILVCLTVPLCLSAVAVGAAGVGSVLNDVNLKQQWDDTMDIYGHVFDELEPGEKDVYKQIIDLLMVKEKRGVAFFMACGGIALLFVVAILNILEHFLAQRKHDDEYGISLISRHDGYKQAQNC